MAHYFTNDDIKSEEIKTKCIINGQTFCFITDNGVFSKRGLDFGTRSLLENIPIDNINGDVLDFGCGYGPIGIYISKNTKSNVDMIDINERAINLAHKNALLNEVNVNIFKSDIYENVLKKYDYIITNPPIRVGKKILYEILFKAYDYLKDNGVMYLVINKDQGAKSLIRDLKNKYKNVEYKKNKGFFIICVTK